ncbi:MAG: M13 family metallopeptidase, partial [Janthinobacterium lividum]
MRSLLSFAAFAAGFGAFSLSVTPRAQQPVAVPVPSVQPLAKMPYSPSLDVQSLDRSVDPCVDFYKFSCGGWVKRNPIPADQAGWSVYAKLANDNQQFLWGILAEDAKAATRTPVQQKVGDYFESCMNMEQINAAGLKPLAPALARLEALSSREALIAALTPLEHETAGSYFFRAGTGQDAVNSSTIIVEIAAGGLGLPDRDYYTQTDPRSAKIREQYSAFVQQLMVLAGETAEQGKGDAEAVLRIETALAKTQLTRVEQRDPHKIYHMMTVAELQQIAPAIRWEHFLDVQGAPGVAKLNVSQPEYMKTVQAELTTEPEAALKAYLRFHLLASAAPYLAKPFADANFEFYSHTLRGVAQPPPRWKTCVRAVDGNLGEALGQEFVARTFTADMKARTELMTGQIEQEMGSEIQGLDWMSPATKIEALRKLHAIRNKIGYPAQWRDYGSLGVERDDYFGDVKRAFQFEEAREWHKLGKPVDLNEWGMTPPTVNAYFNPQMNDINFPAGVLQPPLYDPSLDD